MSPALKIAWRYFRGKKSAQAINIISWISIVAIAISSAAMVILFSVFNGLEDTVKDLYSAFYPQLKVSAEKGKFFDISESQKKEISKINGIHYVSYSLEDMALFSGTNEQKVGALKGVEEAWFAVCGMDSFMAEGRATWGRNENYIPAIVGMDMGISLGVDVQNDFSGLKVFYPRLGTSITEDPESAMNNIVIKPKGTFKIQSDIDDHYVLVPLKAAQYLFHLDNKISSIEVRLNAERDEAGVKKQLENILGTHFIIENRFEQNKTFFMIMHGEKWAVYAILLMVLLIASFNMVGSLSMVVLEKKKDISILLSMGADKSMIRSIFLLEGGLLALVGGGIGILTGILVCLGQMYFGWISLPDGFIISAYPVAIKLSDILLVLSTALIVGLLAAIYPALKAAKQSVFVREE